MDYIVATILSPEDIASKLTDVHDVEIQNDRILCRDVADVPLCIYVSHPDNFMLDWFIHSGSATFVQSVLPALKGQTHFNDESEIFTVAGIPWCEPELREEDKSLWNIASEALIKDSDILGVVHNHSTWSDGKHSIEEMALACMEKGYAYFVISDHSKTAVYAGGLTEKDIAEQQKEIAALNKKYPDFKIFSSIESDILNDGSLDYPDSVLATFDLVIASVHQNLKMDEEKAMMRLLRAIENPYTCILGHMTGRLLLSRPGYPVDHKKIIDACAANKVCIEINANPYRLDMDHTWIPYAMQKGVLLSIDPDAHSTDGIADIHWGVCSARKGGLTAAATLNTKSLPEFMQWLEDRKRK